MVRSKMQLAIAPFKLQPVQTWNFTGCLALNVKMVVNYSYCITPLASALMYLSLFFGQQSPVFPVGWSFIFPDNTLESINSDLILILELSVTWAVGAVRYEQVWRNNR